MKLHNLKAPATNKKNRKRVGRGQGSGTGEQSGRGHNGQKSRSGSKVKPWVEGGQMPLQRRIPKFGFNNRFRTDYKAVNIQKILDFIEAGKLTEDVKLSDLVETGIVYKNDLVKILGKGVLSTALQIEAHSVINSAKKKIEDAGGSVKLLYYIVTLLINS